MLKSFVLKYVVCFFIFDLAAQSACLVSQYNFSGNANDSKGNNHGTVFGATLTQDRFGNLNSAYSFNSSASNYIKIPHTPFFLSNYSYSVWVKPASMPPNGNAFIFLSVGGTGGDQNMQIENNQNNAALGFLTGFTITAYNVNGNYRAGVATNKLPNINEWYHVVCTRDTNYFKIYVNGCLIATSPKTNGSLPSYGTSNLGAAIGARNNATKFFNGVLDDVGIYSCALNADEVSSLYNSFKPFKAWTDTTICLSQFVPFKIKASSGYCSYKWIDIQNRQNILGIDSHLLININKTTVFRVFNNRNDSATVTVKIGSINGVDLGRDTSFCNAFSMTLNAGVGDKFKWSTGDTSKSLIINSSGTYWVIKSDTSGCESIDSITILEYVPKKAVITHDSIPCEGEILNLLVNGSFKSLMWNTNDISQNISVLNDGTYIVYTVDSNGCKSSDTVQIKFKIKAKAAFTATPLNAPIKDAFVSVSNFASNYSKLQYTFGDGYMTDSLNPQHLYLKSGNYKIIQIAISQNGCNDTAEVDLFFYDDFKFLMPNVFSPNNDYSNDVFKPFLNGVIAKDYELKIFNRWGELLFVSNEPNTGWNGLYKGGAVMEGIYLYIVNVRSANKVMHIFQGTFTLLR